MKAEQLLRWGTACPGDFELLKKCLEVTQAMRVVMTGSGLGVLSAVVMEYSKAQLLSIDIDPDNKERENLEAVGLWDDLRIEQHVSDTFCYGQYLGIHTDEQFDVIVLDGGHEYKQVRSDLSVWPDLLSPGGILFVHDYDAKDAPIHHPGVKQAVDESEVAQWPIFGRGGWSIAFQKPPEATCEPS